jgi:hypothetical protein
MTDAMTGHSDAEVLAAFVDGQLDHEQLEAVTTHLATCEECRGVIGEAGAFQMEEEAQRNSRRTWLAVAAAVVVAVVAIPFGRPYVRGYLHQQKIKNSVQSLFAAESQTERNVEARFSDQYTYAKLHRTTRGEEDIPIEIQAAAEDVLAVTEGDQSPTALRAQALAHAALKRQPSLVLDGVKQIPIQSRDSHLWNDIAAANYGAAVRDDKPQLLKPALDAADEALRRQPKMPEALFNRALILQKMNDPRAVGAAKDYLAIDHDSDWAREIQAKMTPHQ